MGMNTTGVVTPATTTYYSRKMLKKAKPYLPHLNWAQVKPIPANESENIRCRRYSLLSVSTDPIVEGVTPTLDLLVVTNVDGSVAQYGRGYLLTDKLLFTTQDPVLNEVADILGQNAANTLDRITRDELGTTTTIQYAGIATQNSEITSAMKLTKAELREATKTLKNNLAEKITEQVDPSNAFNTSAVAAAYIGLVHTNKVDDLRDIPGFVKVEDYGQKKAMENEVGAFENIRFIETTEALVRDGEGAGSIDVYSTLILGKDAYAISEISGQGLRNIIEGPGGNSDPFHQRQTSVWKATFGAFILNDAFVLDLRHA